MIRHKYLSLVMLMAALLSVPAASTGVSAIRYVRAFSGLSLYPDKNQSSPEIVTGT
jgi:hypothetical protein